MRAHITKTTWHGVGKKDDKPCENAIWDNHHKEWFIELETLNDLLDIGSTLVINSAHVAEEHDIDVEIYDDYRE